MFELLRKFSLLMLLFVVAMGSYLAAENSTDWREPLWVQLYPINGDDRDVTTTYINNLREADFAPIENFMRDEANRFHIDMEQPVKILLGDEVRALPPEIELNAGPLDIIAWSLKLRWWAGSVTDDQPGPEPDIRLFLVFFDPEKRPALSHSIGLQQGLLGVVNLFARQSQAETNNFVIAHEMLHTLGATDKYDLRNNMPSYPDGFAHPERRPLYPQTHAEIMGGRIALDDRSAMIPASLDDALVGPLTAEEIRWLR